MTGDTTQKQEFLAHEGDAWFQRNEAATSAASVLRDEFAKRVAAHLPVPHADVLEIGCAQGANLAALAACAPIRGCGIEPSAQAVEVGRKALPGMDIRCGTADALPYDAASFDVVWFGFCLYLVDRSLLHRCVAEADRVLRDNGLLVIVDFDPDAPTRRAYHHRAGLWSYKADHSQFFLADPAYRLVEKLSASHAGVGWVDDPQERIALWICRKNTEHAYRTP